MTSFISPAQALPTAAQTEPSQAASNSCTEADVEALAQRWNEGYLPAGPALKACGDRALTALEATMTDTTIETIRRGISARLIGQIGSPKALEILLTTLQTDTVAIVGLQAVNASASGAQSRTDFLQTALTSEIATTRIGAAYALAKINSPKPDNAASNDTRAATHNSAVATLAQVINDDTAPRTNRELAARFMNSLGTADSINQLIKSVEQNNSVALASLSSIKATPAAIAQLTQALSHHDQTVRISAAYALAFMGDNAETAIPELAISLARKMWDPAEEDFRAMVIYALGEINPLHPQALGALGSVTARGLFGYESGEFEPSLQVRAVATEALNKIDRQANVRSLLALLATEEAPIFSTAWGAEFVLTAPMDDALEATVFEYLSNASTPTDLRIGAAKFITVKHFDEDNFVPNNLAQLAALLVTIVEDDTADIRLRNQAAISLTETIFFIEGTADTIQPFIPRIAASLEQAEDPETIYNIANVLGAIYVKSAYPGPHYTFYGSGAETFKTERVAAIESALIGIVSGSQFYQAQWKEAAYFPGPFEMEAFSNSASGLAFGLLKSANTQQSCAETLGFCPITDTLKAFITPMKAQNPDLLQLWIRSAQAPMGTPDMTTADDTYTLDRDSAERFAASVAEETGGTQPAKPAICHLAIAPQLMPECR
ncbi:MAG: hypothetical protein AAFP03_02395 [Cyanobacteria bacterium J06598_3]